MSLVQRFIATINEQHLFQKDDPLILAVSGGVDSVVLCELCFQAGFDFSIAHCNFQLRGEESDRDENFVKQLATKYNRPVYTKQFDTGKYAATQKLSIQEAARELRYNWFHELISQLSKKETSSIFTIHYSLFTAHHADDNTETLLMNFFRGTGLHGLTGIPAVNGYIKRPLLSFTRNEIVQYAGEQGLQWVEDSSNSSSKYTRNYLRNELIPALTAIYPHLQQNLQGNIARFKDTEALYNELVGKTLKKLIVVKGKEVHVPVRALLGYNNRALVYELIAPYGFSEKQVDEVIRLGQRESGKYIASQDQSHRIIRHRLWFILSPVQETDKGTIIIEEGDREVVFPGGSLTVVLGGADSGISGNPDTASLDARQISYPLLLRRWKTGDYFYPLGMRKKKKISRFLIDSKLSKTEKENTWVLESGGRIIWVVGRRIDDRFKLSASVKEVFNIRLKSNQT